ncbi:hypothetical protein Cgig2_019654 [Carnegiea gigantea]|uniref:Uncharacterized protein n=1 Tax=Carnegiea gigantea TaxID=171969 RepID=A0A9Q1KJ67_9CARY|nr:hypothetical protein Cgig2_019654 [Carnegiea gigantea]
MEGSSHSHSHNRSYSHHSRSHSRGGPTAFSAGATKKPPMFPSAAGNAAFFTTSYDDVFGGPPTYAALAPRPDDYSEIFGAFRSSAASRASSIPVLDLPAVADIDAAAAAFLDYSEVFGGFDAVDFAVPYDELFRPFDAGDGDCSSDEACRKYQFSSH